MKLLWLKNLLLATVFITCSITHAGFADKDAKVTDRLLKRGFSIQESTVSGLLEIAKANGKVGEISFTFSPVLQLKEFLPLSPAAINEILNFIERSEAGEFSIQRPEDFIQLIFESTLLPSETLNRVDQIAKKTKNKILKLKTITKLIHRNYNVEAMTKSLLLLTLDLDETISLPASLELLKTNESKWAEERIQTLLPLEKPRQLLTFLLRNGDYFSEMSDALIRRILNSVDDKAKDFLLSAMQLKEFARAQKLRRSAFSKIEQCLLYLNPF